MPCSWFGSVLLMPHGGPPPGPGFNEHQLQQMIAEVQCLREHGFRPSRPERRQQHRPWNLPSRLEPLRASRHQSYEGMRKGRNRDPRLARVLMHCEPGRVMSRVSVVCGAGLEAPVVGSWLTRSCADRRVAAGRFGSLFRSRWLRCGSRCRVLF